MIKLDRYVWMGSCSFLVCSTISFNAFAMETRGKQGRDVSKLWLRFFYEDFCDGIFCSKHSSIVEIKRKKIKKRDENGIVF